MMDRLALRDLFDTDSLVANRTWQPLREGVEISIIYQEPDNGPCAAFLRYQPGASVPSHEHLGFEHILILAGEQKDAAGSYPKGTLLIHRPSTNHSVISEKGCIALAVWHSPVRFI